MLQSQPRTYGGRGALATRGSPGAEASTDA